MSETYKEVKQLVDDDLSDSEFQPIMEKKHVTCNYLDALALGPLIATTILVLMLYESSPQPLRDGVFVTTSPGQQLCMLGSESTHYPMCQTFDNLELVSGVGNTQYSWGETIESEPDSLYLPLLNLVNTPIEGNRPDGTRRETDFYNELLRDKRNVYRGAKYYPVSASYRRQVSGDYVPLAIPSVTVTGTVTDISIVSSIDYCTLSGMCVAVDFYDGRDIGLSSDDIPAQSCFNFDLSTYQGFRLTHYEQVRKRGEHEGGAEGYGSRSGQIFTKNAWLVPSSPEAGSGNNDELNLLVAEDYPLPQTTGELPNFPPGERSVPIGFHSKQECDDYVSKLPLARESIFREIGGGLRVAMTGSDKDLYDSSSLAVPSEFKVAVVNIPTLNISRSAGGEALYSIPHIPLAAYGRGRKRASDNSIFDLSAVNAIPGLGLYADVVDSALSSGDKIPGFPNAFHQYYNNWKNPHPSQQMNVRKLMSDDHHVRSAVLDGRYTPIGSPLFNTQTFSEEDNINRMATSRRGYNLVDSIIGYESSPGADLVLDALVEGMDYSFRSQLDEPTLNLPNWIDVRGEGIACSCLPSWVKDAHLVYCNEPEFQNPHDDYAIINLDWPSYAGTSSDPGDLDAASHPYARPCDGCNFVSENSLRGQRLQRLNVFPLFEHGTARLESAKPVCTRIPSSQTTTVSKSTSFTVPVVSSPEPVSAKLAHLEKVLDTRGDGSATYWHAAGGIPSVNESHSISWSARLKACNVTGCNNPSDLSQSEVISALKDRLICRPVSYTGRQRLAPAMISRSFRRGMSYFTDVSSGKTERLETGRDWNHLSAMDCGMCVESPASMRTQSEVSELLVVGLSLTPVSSGVGPAFRYLFVSLIDRSTVVDLIGMMRYELHAGTQLDYDVSSHPAPGTISLSGDEGFDLVIALSFPSVSERNLFIQENAFHDLLSGASGFVESESSVSNFDYIPLSSDPVLSLRSFHVVNPHLASTARDLIASFSSNFRNVSGHVPNAWSSMFSPRWGTSFIGPDLSCFPELSPSVFGISVEGVARSLTRPAHHCGPDSGEPLHVGSVMHVTQMCGGFEPHDGSLTMRSQGVSSETSGVGTPLSARKSTASFNPATYSYMDHNGSLLEWSSSVWEMLAASQSTQQPINADEDWGSHCACWMAESIDQMDIAFTPRVNSTPPFELLSGSGVLQRIGMGEFRPRTGAYRTNVSHGFVGIYSTPLAAGECVIVDHTHANYSVKCDGLNRIAVSVNGRERLAFNAVTANIPVGHLWHSEFSGSISEVQITVGDEVNRSETFRDVTYSICEPNYPGISDDFSGWSRGSIDYWSCEGSNNIVLSVVFLLLLLATVSCSLRFLLDSFSTYLDAAKITMEAIKLPFIWIWSILHGLFSFAGSLWMGLVLVCSRFRRVEGVIIPTSTSLSCSGGQLGSDCVLTAFASGSMTGEGAILVETDAGVGQLRFDVSSKWSVAANPQYGVSSSYSRYCEYHGCFAKLVSHVAADNCHLASTTPSATIITDQTGDASDCSYAFHSANIGNWMQCNEDYGCTGGRRAIFKGGIHIRTGSTGAAGTVYSLSPWTRLSELKIVGSGVLSDISWSGTVYAGQTISIPSLGVLNVEFLVPESPPELSWAVTIPNVGVYYLSDSSRISATQNPIAGKVGEVQYLLKNSSAFDNRINAYPFRYIFAPTTSYGNQNAYARLLVDATTSFDSTGASKAGRSEWFSSVRSSGVYRGLSLPSSLSSRLTVISRVDSYEPTISISAEMTNVSIYRSVSRVCPVTGEYFVSGCVCPDGFELHLHVYSSCDPGMISISLGDDRSYEGPATAANRIYYRRLAQTENIVLTSVVGRAETSDSVLTFEGLSAVNQLDFDLTVQSEYCVREGNCPTITVKAPLYESDIEIVCGDTNCTEGEIVSTDDDSSIFADLEFDDFSDFLNSVLGVVTIIVTIILVLMLTYCLISCLCKRM